MTAARSHRHGGRTRLRRGVLKPAVSFVLSRTAATWSRPEDSLSPACHVCFREGFRGGELTGPVLTSRLWGAEAGGSRSTATTP